MMDLRIAAVVCPCPLGRVQENLERLSRLTRQAAARGARLVFGSDHSVSTGVDYEDYLLAMDVYREHMMY